MIELGAEDKQRKPRILIVDDNSTNILVLEKMLKIYGYDDIKTLTDSREVVETYISYSPDILLLDLKMPYLDGFQVLEQLNRVKMDDYIPVIVITAQSDKESRMKALKMGAKDFIVKPFDSAEIMMRIANMLEIRMLHNKVLENNKELEKRVKERTEELQNLQLELIQRLLRAAEFRDNDTGYHINRIGEYSSELGKAAGLNKDECYNLMHASMMHDVGKIAIPDNILLKPGKLDSEEWKIMKQHTVKGAELLSGSFSEILKLAEQIALTHHEKWDGSGYPNGISGEEIPLVGRITAICDVFDALLSKRPYKEPWELDKVIAEIKKGSDNHFDPNLVDLFLKNLDIFINIKNKFESDEINQS